MPIKYSLGHSCKVVNLEYEDLERIDFTTIEGREVMQEIVAIEDQVYHYVDYDDAIESDMAKYSKEERKKLPFDEFKKDLYMKSLEEEL